MSAILCHGVWLPDDDQHFHPAVAGEHAYQGSKQKVAYQLAKHRRVAVDVGAHCGLWSMYMIQMFDELVAFEPVDRHCECWNLNVVPREGHKATLHRVALGERDGTCGIKVLHENSGMTHIEGDGEYPVRRLDDYHLENVDLIKLDCEGYELFALRGAEDTLKRCKPAICVEQKQGHGSRYGISDTAALDYLVSLGAKLRGQKIGDYYFTWDETC